MKLQSEPVYIKLEERPARRETLRSHGATPEEIEFLVPLTDECRRVELNAMTSSQLIEFIEAALAAHGVRKVIPDRETLEQQARHRLEVKYSEELLARHGDDIARRAAQAPLPPDIYKRIADLLDKERELSWDQALAKIIDPEPPRRRIVLKRPS
jgi:hypothetical protein